MNTPGSDQPPLKGARRARVWMNSLFVDHAFLRVGFNTRSKVTDELYRSSHPLPYQLRQAYDAGIRSVLSLRGAETHVGSNQLEWEACRKLGLPLVHYPIGSRDAPSREQVLAINDFFRTLPKPILVHCKSGADRAGLACVLFRLMQRKQPLEIALTELSFVRFGHVSQAKTGILDHFFEVYRQHRDRFGTGFEDWLREHYDREAVRTSFHSNWWANQLTDRLLRRE